MSCALVVQLEAKADAATIFDDLEKIGNGLGYGAHRPAGG